MNRGVIAAEDVADCLTQDTLPPYPDCLLSPCKVYDRTVVQDVFGCGVEYACIRCVHLASPAFSFVLEVWTGIDFDMRNTHGVRSGTLGAAVGDRSAADDENAHTSCACSLPSCGARRPSGCYASGCSSRSRVLYCALAHTGMRIVLRARGCAHARAHTHEHFTCILVQIFIMYV